MNGNTDMGYKNCKNFSSDSCTINSIGQPCNTIQVWQFLRNKVLQILQLIPLASQKYNPEHFLYHQLLLLIMILIATVLNQLSNHSILHLYGTNNQKFPRYMPNIISFVLHCYCKQMVSVSPFSCASKGLFVQLARCCIL